MRLFLLVWKNESLTFFQQSKRVVGDRGHLEEALDSQIKDNEDSSLEAQSLPDQLR